MCSLWGCSKPDAINLLCKKYLKIYVIKGWCFYALGVAIIILSFCFHIEKPHLDLLLISAYFLVLYGLSIYVLGTYSSLKTMKIVVIQFIILMLFNNIIAFSLCFEKTMREVMTTAIAQAIYLNIFLLLLIIDFYLFIKLKKRYEEAIIKNI